MFGHFGFSYVGLIFLLMLMIPNLIWTKGQPQGYSAENENRFLGVLERVGEVLTTCVALIFSDFNLQRLSKWSLWLVAAFALMVMYEIWWVRYFRSERRLADFYSSFLGIPVAGATLPVAAFFLLGIYGKVIWMMIASVILGIGHIGIHLQHRREVKIKYEDNLFNETFHPGTDRPSNGADTVVGGGKKTCIREKERVLWNYEML